MKNKTLSIVAASLLVAGLFVGCGSSSSGEAPKDGSDSKDKLVTKTITVIDGYVKGSTVSAVGSTKGKPGTTDEKGMAEVSYEDSLKDPVFVAKGGETSTGLKVGTLKTKAGGNVANQFTTSPGAFAAFKLDDNLKAQAEGDFIKAGIDKTNADFAKAAVLLARMQYCAENPAKSNDNATLAAVQAELTKAAEGAADTAAVVKALSEGEGAGKSIAKAIMDANASVLAGGVEALEEAIKDVSCDEVSTPVTPGGNDDNKSTVDFGKPSTDPKDLPFG